MIGRYKRNSLKTDEKYECDFYKPDVCDPSKLPCSKTENCVDTYGHSPAGLRHACFTAWTNDTVEGIKVELKGCWLAQDVEPFDCGHNECVAETPASTTFKTESGGPTAFFCCCNTPKCNEKFYYRPAASTPAPKPKEITQPTSTDVTASLVYAFAPLCLLVLLILACYYIYRKYKLRQTIKRMTRNGRMDASSLPLKIPPSPTDISKSIELIEIVSRGRYGNVWKARTAADEQFVAVKVFPPQDVDSWVQEQEIYGTPGLKHHPNVLHFLSAECKINANGNTEYWLITAYQELGSLHDYLKKHTVSMAEMLQIITSMLRGLAYLHEESSMTDQQSFKPTIVHRDFKSRNVLLKTGLTAFIADFGLALKCVQGRTPNDVHAQVGTRRYMAPEVLEGATEFSAFAFRQIDVYAAALVVWEVLSRCSLTGEKVDEYRLPFDEIGTRPTLEQLQDHVVVKKQRPPIKLLWRQHTIGAVICSTIEEMWDAEPEARVTAGCALERFCALQSAIQSAAPTLSSYSSYSGISSGGVTTSEKLETAPLIVSETPALLGTKIV